MPCQNPSDSQFMMSTTALPVCRAATSCIVCIWDWENYVVKTVICAAYGCYNRSDKRKGKWISLFSIPNPRIKPEKKHLAARWLFKIGTGWTEKNYSFSGAQRLCHEHFEESCFEAELQTRLGFRRFKRLKPGAVPTTFYNNTTQSLIQLERKERAQKPTKKKARSVTSSCWMTISP